MADSAPNPRSIAALDGLRGVAVLIVFLSHAGNAGVHLVPGLDCSGIGKSGVMLFFVLSSFLLTTAFLQSGDAALTVSALRRYALRRMARIFPLYVVCLVAALATTWASVRLFRVSKPIGAPFTLSGVEFVRHVALLEGKGVTWSIPVECRYYLALPLVAFLFHRVLKQRLVPCALATAAGIAACAVLWPQSTSHVNDDRIGPYLPVFLLGSLTALGHALWNRQPFAARQDERRRTEAIGWTAVVLLLLVTHGAASWILGQPLPRDVFSRQFLCFGGLWCLVLFASLNGAGGLATVLELRWLRRIGQLCFGMYLLHPAVIHGLLAVRLPVPELALGYLMLAVSVLVAHACYVLVERPCLNFTAARRPPSPQHQRSEDDLVAARRAA